jgi:hypothetical protein
MVADKIASCSRTGCCWNSRSSALVALQNANCTTVGGEFDFCEAAAHGAEEALGKSGCNVPNAVRVRLQIRFRLIVDRTRGGLRVKIERIVSGEVDLDGALAALHGVDAGADEVPVKKDIAGHSEERDTAKARLYHLRVAADGVKIKFASALRAHERAASGAHHDVARDFFQVDIAGHALQGHVPHDLLDINQTGLSLELKLGFFGDGQLEIGLELVGRRGAIEDGGGHVDAFLDLFGNDADFVGGLRRGDNDFRVF